MGKIEINEDLAEFLGAYLGDGYINNQNYEISIVCGEVDKQYITKYIPILMKKLFDKEAKISYLGNTKAIKARIYSKDNLEFLMKTFNLNAGKKIKPKIPDVIFTNKNYLKKCIRGLIDTDGGLHRHHKRSIQLKFDNKEKSLIKSLKIGLKILGFSPILSKQKNRDVLTIYLFGKQVDKYFKEIGFSNQKNKIKYSIWKKKGITPKNSEISEFLKVL